MQDFRDDEGPTGAVIVWGAAAFIFWALMIFFYCNVFWFRTIVRALWPF